MLDFDEEHHVYRWNDQIVPSVTQALKPLYSYEGIPEEVLIKAGKRGSYVHTATELFDLDDLDEESVLPEFKGYLEAWKRLRDETGAELVDIERRGYHADLGYAGTWDRVWLLNKGLDLADIKTPAIVSRVDALQTAAYEAIRNKVTKGRRKIKRRFTAQLGVDGNYHLINWCDPLVRERYRLQANPEMDLPNFISALNVHRWKEAA